MNFVITRIFACALIFYRHIVTRCVPDVEWPNGMEGGTVCGHAAVRQYWTRQWTMINPSVGPLQFRLEETNRTVAVVHQVV